MRKNNSSPPASNNFATNSEQIGGFGHASGEFLEALPGRLVEIHQLQAADQWKELDRAAHALTGLVGMFGLQPLADRARSSGAGRLPLTGNVQSLVASLDQQLVIATQQLSASGSRASLPVPSHEISRK